MLVAVRMRLVLLIAVFTAALPGSLPADNHWIRVTTPHFELFTDAGDKKGRAAILYFEQARSFFEQASPVRKESEFPVRLILFENEKTYAPYRVSQAAASYATANQGRDYVVLGETQETVFRPALHEYMHVILRHSGLRLPVWLNEGWADVYSTLRPAGKGAAIGDILDERWQSLKRDPWLSFERLTTVTQSSPEYNELSRAGIFYAESWALVHMLYLSPEYKGGFATFINAVNDGQTAAQACSLAWNKSSQQVFADLRTYMDRKHIFGAIYAARLEKSAENPTAEPLSPLGSELMLSELLSAIGRLDAAQQRLERVAETNRDNPEVSRLLGYVALARRDPESARRYFEDSMKHGQADPRMYLHLCALQLQQKAPYPLVHQSLARALELKPDFAEARLEFGLLLLAENQPQGSLDQLLLVKSVDPDHAARLFNALAFAYARTGDRAKSQENATKALKWARTDADRKQAEDLLHWSATR